MNTLPGQAVARNATAQRQFVLLLIVALASPQQIIAAETNVFLGGAGSFAVLAGSSFSNDTNNVTVLVGNLGVSPGTNVLLGSITVRGTTHIADATAANAQTNLIAAYNDAAARTSPIVVSGDIGGMTFTPGLYASAASLEITSSDLTLDAQGNPAAVFIFQVASNFTVAADREVILVGAARAANVFWQVGDSVTLEARSLVNGNILANQSITMESRATLDGRALARMGATDLNANVITTPLGGTTNDVPVDVSVLTPITLNPQTGLFEQTIRAYNAGVSTNAIAPLIVLIRGLPSDVTVYNASGIDVSDAPFVRYQLPLPANQSVNFLIEYYRRTRRAFTQPTFAPSMGIPSSTNVPTDRIVELNRPVEQLPQSGRFLIEFSATPGKRYEVQYSTNMMMSWRSATPPITAPADKVQWLDDGPPKTDSAPSSLGSRVYRVVELP